MKIDILCTAPDHPVVPWLRRWMDETGRAGHVIALHHDRSSLSGGDVLFLISCSQLIGEAVRGKYGEVLVLHASDLPAGRGWSPHIWAILGGAEQVTLSMISAADPVDTGDIWAKTTFDVPRHALHHEINAALFEAELALMSRALEMMEAGERPVPQPPYVPGEGAAPPWWPRRTPADSALDPQRPLAELFDQIRVADPERYPAFFTLHGRRFTLRIESAETDD
ncbi:MAG: formyltransferase family protein [Brevundimonas sp.]|jgi:methionyl-tRNA formyltransferase|uniref:formyltransferase family protein n=1 Tax=Brevundimonas sp. TaxID=1871086 RepID=UPI00391A0D5A